MSQVKDSEGNVLNPQHGLRGRYTSDALLEQDWFTLHPESKPKEEKLGDLTLSGEQAKEVAKQIADAAAAALERAASQIEALAKTAPTAADLDAVAAEQKAADATAGSNNDVPQVQLPSGQPESGLVAEPTLSQSASASEPAAEVPATTGN